MRYGIVLSIHTGEIQFVIGFGIWKYFGLASSQSPSVYGNLLCLGPLRIGVGRYV